MHSKLFYIESIRDAPEKVFGNIAQDLEWDVCEQFCKVFNINFAMCIEFTGDEMLRAAQTRSALQCYSVARVTIHFGFVLNKETIYFSTISCLDPIGENRSETGHVWRKQCAYAFVCNGPENDVRPKEHTSAKLSHQLFGRSAGPEI